MTPTTIKLRNAVDSAALYGEKKQAAAVAAVISAVSDTAPIYDFLDDGVRSNTEVVRLTAAVAVCAMDNAVSGRPADLTTLKRWSEVQAYWRSAPAPFKKAHPMPILTDRLDRNKKPVDVAGMSSSALTMILNQEVADGLDTDKSLVLAIEANRIAERRRLAGRSLAGMLVSEQETAQAILPALKHIGLVKDGKWAIKSGTVEEFHQPLHAPVEQSHPEHSTVTSNTTTDTQQFPRSAPMSEQMEWALVHGAPTVLGKRGMIAAGTATAATPLLASLASADAGVNVAAGIIATGLGYIATLGTLVALRKRAELPVAAPTIDVDMQQHVVPHVTKIERAAQPVPVMQPAIAPVVQAVTDAITAPKRGLAEIADKINETFAAFGARDKGLCGANGEFIAVDAGYHSGITVDVFPLVVPIGVSVPKIRAQAENLKLHLQASDVSIDMADDGAHLRVLVAKQVRVPVLYKELATIGSKAKLPLIMGRDSITGAPIVADLDDLPHLLVAGATRQGKSNWLNQALAALHKHCSPDDLRTVLIDAKGGNELRDWASAPHCALPMATNAKEAMVLLRKVIAELQWRMSLGVRNARDWKGEATAPAGCISQGTVTTLPSIMVIVDEQAQLMLQDAEFAATVENLQVQIAQLAAAYKIHLVICTQRPEVDVVTGLLKANIIPRLSFLVSSKDDSMIILDRTGAQNLYGKGEFYFTSGGVELVRGQAGLITSEEIAECVASL